MGAAATWGRSCGAAAAGHTGNAPEEVGCALLTSADFAITLAVRQCLVDTPSNAIQNCHMERIITIDRAGRLVVPKDIRKRLHLRGGSRIRLTEEDNQRLVLEPVDDADCLVEVGGLLIATGTHRGEWVDHRTLRDERIEDLADID